MIKISIDATLYEVSESELSGIALKNLASIAASTALFIEVSDAPDIEISNDTLYPLKNKMQFFTEEYHPTVQITIDKKKYTVKTRILGKDLRELANISTAYNLVREQKDAADEKIDDGTIYTISKNDEFFTIPAIINNGAMRI